MTLRRSATLFPGLVLLLATLGSAAAGESPRVTITADELVVRAHFDAPEFVAVEGGVVPVIGDWPSLADAPGLPRLPVVHLQVVLPPGMEPGPARALGLPRELPGTHAFAWGQPPERLSRPEGRRAEPRAEVYGSDQPYPAVPARLVGVGLFRGYRVATIAVTPLQVRAASGRARLWSELELRLPLRPVPAARAAVAPAPRGLPRDLAALARFTANPEAAYLSGAPDSGRDADIPYLIVTTEELRPAFERLLALRAAQGVAGELRTVGAILAEEPGRDNPEKLRNAIARAYRDHGTTFV
nr:C25 family cysteine peptidase [Acidobacteriota bacterium]